MSTILDALRKLQRDRESDRGRSDPPPPPEPSDDAPGRRVPGALTLVGLALVAASVAWIYLELGRRGDALDPGSETGVAVADARSAADDGASASSPGGTRAPPLRVRAPEGAHPIPTAPGFADGPAPRGAPAPRPASVLTGPEAQAPPTPETASQAPEPESSSGVSQRSATPASPTGTRVAQADPQADPTTGSSKTPRGAPEEPASPPATREEEAPELDEKPVRAPRRAVTRESTTTSSPEKRLSRERETRVGVGVKIIRPEAEPEPPREVYGEKAVAVEPAQKEAPREPRAATAPDVDPTRPVTFPSLRVASIRWHPEASRRIAVVVQDDGEELELHEGDIIAGVLIRHIEPDALELSVGSVSRHVQIEP